MAIEIALKVNLDDQTGVKFWTGPVTTEAVELKVIESAERGPVTQASPQELSAYNDAIDRLVKTFGLGGATPLGLWTNGLTPSISLPKDAKPEEVIAAALKKSLLPEEFQNYRILHIRDITADASRQSVTAALIQTDSKTRILVFFPVKEINGWWTRLYDTDLNAVPAAAATAPTTQTSPTSSKLVEKDGLSVQVSLKKSEISTDEQPQFTVRFTNGNDEYINLFGVDEYWNWKVRFTNLDQEAEDPGPRLLNVQAQFRRHFVSTKHLKPGDVVDVPVDINNTGFATDFTYDGPFDHLVAPIKRLKPGTYKMTIEIALPPNSPDDSGTKYWTGPVTTEAVELKVDKSGQGGSATQAAPVEKDGLSVQVSLKKSEISTDEQPQFTVRFTNSSKESINLCGADEYWEWKVRFTNLDQKAEDPGPWLLNVNSQRIRHLVSSIKLKSGDFIDVPVDFNNANFKPDFAYDGIIKHLIAPVKHLKPGTYNMTIEIALQPDPLDKSGAKYWTGPVTTEAVELKVVESDQQGPATEPSPQDLSASDGAIDRVIKALPPGGLWANGTYPSPVSRLAADAKAQVVIADAVKAWFPNWELKDYRVLQIRENVKLPPDYVFSAAVIQAGAEYKVLLFHPSTGGGWWAHFYDTDLHTALPPANLTDPNVIAVGDWSDEVAGLRGRLLIANGRVFADGKLHETVAYLELRNSPDAAGGNSKSVYFDPDISCEMLDPQGVTVPQGGRGYSGGGGGRPNVELVTLPYDSTIRLRLSPYGYGSEDGLRIDISQYEWNIKSTDKGEYTLSATFTSDPAQQQQLNTWHGTLKLPAIKIATGSDAAHGQ
jgi:hypothetical protein